MLPGLLMLAGFLNATLAQVILTDNGSSVTLANGVVSAVIDKSNGRCTDLRKGGGSNLLANGGRLYFDANGSVNGGSSGYVSFTPDSYSVITNSPQRVEIALTDTNLTGFNAELHYVLRMGDSGLYVFTVWRHGVGDPQAMLEQSRMVLRCDPNIFTRAYSSTNKVGQMIEPSLLQTSPQIMDATYQLPLVSSYTNATGSTEDGFPVYTKYDWCDYMENHTVEGLSSETLGLWMLFGSVEYFNGGPTKANLLLHGSTTTPLLLWDFHAQHFGGSKIDKAAGELWEKIMGPYFIYVNSGTNASQLWQDAQSMAALEQAAWPYEWMTHNLYPTDRGVVTGKLHVLGESTENALLVLAQPGSYWQYQGEGYQFWTRAAADGSFTIPKVRPGAYSLFARVPGVIGEFELAAVVVDPGEMTDVGLLNWNPPRREQRLWRIGTPDLFAGEFRFGDQMRQFGLWWRYMEEQGTNDLVYHVGSSVATNWYYAQSVVAMDGGTYFSPTWKVEFVLTNLPPSPAVLTVDLAGSLKGTLLTTVNGGSLNNVTLTNDACIYRSATRGGAFRHVEWSFSPNLLQPGTNVIAFSVSKSASWSGSKPVQPTRGVIYDCIQLEAGALVDSITPRFTSVDQMGTELQLNGTGGFPQATYRLLTTGDVTTSPGGWTPVVSNRFDGGGRFEVTSGIDSNVSPRFYRIQVP